MMTKSHKIMFGVIALAILSLSVAFAVNNSTGKTGTKANCCSVEKADCPMEKACCPSEKAGCPMEKTCCSSEKAGCPMEKACCPADKSTDACCWDDCKCCDGCKGGACTCDDCQCCDCCKK